MNKTLIILAFYFRLKDDSLAEQEAFQNKKMQLGKVADRFATSNIDVNIFVFPTTQGDDRVECVYPKFIVNEDMHTQFENSLNDFKEIIKKFGETNGHTSQN